jgi:hypothetical protein
MRRKESWQRFGSVCEKIVDEETILRMNMRCVR